HEQWAVERRAGGGDERARRFAPPRVREAAGEEAREVLADDRVGRVGQAKLLKRGRAGLLRHLVGAREREEAIDERGLERFACQGRGYGAGEQARAARGNGDGRLREGLVFEERLLRAAGGVDEGEELPVVDGLARVFELRLEGVGQREVHVVAAQQDVLAHADALERQLA